MKDAIKKRIEAVQRGEVPEGYQRTKDIGIAPNDWLVGKLSDILHCEQRPVPKPTAPYWRLGVKSWAKGTFHAYVDDPVTVDMDELYTVRENDLIVNITFAWEHAIAIVSKEDDGLLVSHRFPTYVFDCGNVPSYYKEVVSQHFFRDMLDNISPGGAGRNRVLNRKDFLSLPCYIPPIHEQKRIAEIISKQVTLIELCQQKIDQLKLLKKRLLEKMFPQKGCDVPEIRFPGFTAPWEQRKFSETFTTLQNNTLSRAELSPEGGHALNVHYGDVLIKFGEIIDAAEAALPFIPNADVVAKFKGSALEDGDIIIADTAEDETVGKCSEMLNLQGKTAISGLHTIPCRPTVKFARGYLGYYMNSSSFHDQLLPLMQGIKVTSISKSALQDTVLRWPKSTDEQSKIGQYFMSLDNLITLHQRELAEEQRKKKALMQLLLTGLVRVNA